MKLSICIPAYNEAANLPLAVEQVERLFARGGQGEGPLQEYELEIVVTDNASSDATWAVIQELSRSRVYLKGYRFSRNFGYQNSIFAGLSLATGDAVIELDADLEDPPTVIPRFVERWREGYEVVYGVRAKRFAPWYMKVLFATFYKLLHWISDLKIPERTGDFRLLDRKVVEVLKSLPERNLYLRGLVTYLGFRQCPVVYDRQPRVSGESKFRILHYLVLAIDAVTAFTKAPLRLMGALGAILFVLALALSAYYVVGFFLHGREVPGFTSLVVLMLFLHSVTFIFLGVLGEYLSRVFDDSKFRPRVIIADAVNVSRFPQSL
ncbi:MAG: glycosyltransferase family 2 protein [Bacteriovoracia bacterium]